MTSFDFSDAALCAGTPQGKQIRRHFSQIHRLVYEYDVATKNKYIKLCGQKDDKIDNLNKTLEEMKQQIEEKFDRSEANQERIVRQMAADHKITEEKLETVIEQTKSDVKHVLKDRAAPPCNDKKIECFAIINKYNEEDSIDSDDEDCPYVRISGQQPYILKSIKMIEKHYDAATVLCNIEVPSVINFKDVIIKKLKNNGEFREHSSKKSRFYSSLNDDEITNMVLLAHVKLTKNVRGRTY